MVKRSDLYRFFPKLLLKQIKQYAITVIKYKLYT
jgi:hypothetical protein